MLAPETVATPFVNEIVVVEPNAVATPEELATVAAVPFGLAEAPLKVRLLRPV